MKIKGSGDSGPIQVTRDIFHTERRFGVLKEVDAINPVTITRDKFNGFRMDNKVGLVARVDRNAGATMEAVEAAAAAVGAMGEFPISMGGPNVRLAAVFSLLIALFLFRFKTFCRYVGWTQFKISA